MSRAIVAGLGDTSAPLMASLARVSHYVVSFGLVILVVFARVAPVEIYALVLIAGIVIILAIRLKYSKNQWAPTRS